MLYIILTLSKAKCLIMHVNHERDEWNGLQYLESFTATCTAFSALSFAPIPSANNSCFFIHLLSYSLPLFVFHSQRIKSKIISIESPLSTNSMVQSSLRTTMFLCMLLRMSPWYMRPWNCNLWPSFCLLVSISAPNSRPCRFYKSQKNVWIWQDTCYQAVST